MQKPPRSTFTGRRLALALALFAVAASFACGAVLGVDFGAARLDPDAAAGGDGGASANGCLPKICEAQGFSCGVQNDGCGGALECGSCKGSVVCTAGKCTCRPKTCPEIGATCGTVDDGCGSSLSCGNCANADDACVANKCACQPKSCTTRSATCGAIPDGCGNTYDCGSCADAGAPNCGGDGPNRCGATPCVPLTCTGHCGDMSDGCGAILHCPGCTAPDFCGSGGTANVCGCTPTTCTQQGKNCSTIPDGCGGTLDCGGCTAPQTCAGAGTPNVCGCTPSTTCAPGNVCGTNPDGCGGNVSCGPACVAPQTCGGGGAPNICGCTPRTCGDFLCGSHPNGCGGNVFCGTCACFPAGTRITMADGTTKPIELVVAGDVVRSADPATGVIGAARVTEQKQHESELSNAGIVVLDGTLRATRNHPIWANGKLVTLEDVRAGDEVFIASSSTTAPGAVKKRIESVALEPGGVVTYDLVLAGGGHFFANDMLVAQKIQP